ncbi:MAG: VanZ family protein [Betaproteobacteria bacterium]|nr:VanZ family protein [Betaproteobacteria bacterium]
MELPKRPTLYRIAAIGIVLAILVLSLMPAPPGVPGSDKLHHFLAYMSCMFAWALALARPKSRLVALILICAMGVIIEFLQGWSGWRTFDGADMAANALGAMCGWIASRVHAQLAVRFGAGRA